MVASPNPERRTKQQENAYPVLVVSRIKDIDSEEQKALEEKQCHSLLDVVLTQPKTALITDRIDGEVLRQLDSEIEKRKSNHYPHMYLA